MDKLDSESIIKIGTEEVLIGYVDYAASDGALSMSKYGTTLRTHQIRISEPNDFFFPVLSIKAAKGCCVWPEGWKEADFVAP